MFIFGIGFLSSLWLYKNKKLDFENSLPLILEVIRRTNHDDLMYLNVKELHFLTD